MEYSSLQQLATPLRELVWHMGSHSVTILLLPVTLKRLHFI